MKAKGWLHGRYRYCKLLNFRMNAVKNKIVFIALAGLLAAARADDLPNVLTLGGGIGIGPRFSGSDENVVGPVAGIDYQMANGFYASTLRGIGYGRAFGPLTVGAALGYRGERSEHDRRGLGGARGSTALRGMGDVKGSATAMLQARYEIVDGLDLTLQAELPISHRENGRTLQVGVTGTLFEGGADQVTLSLSATLADRDYMQTYYGVTAAQAMRSGYGQFRPKAGLYETELGLNWRHTINDRWSLTAMVGVTSLRRDAARSPLSGKDTAPTGALIATWRYRRARRV